MKPMMELEHFSKSHFRPDRDHIHDMNAPIPFSSAGISLPGGADPVALLEVGLRPPATGSGAWQALSAAEAGIMLPAYGVRRMIGQGGMGAVYEAVQRDLHRKVAINLLSPALAERPGLAGSR